MKKIEEAGKGYYGKTAGKCKPAANLQGRQPSSPPPAPPPLTPSSLQPIKTALTGRLSRSILSKSSSPPAEPVFPADETATDIFQHSRSAGWAGNPAGLKASALPGACLPSPLDPKDGDIFGLSEERGAAGLPLGRLVLPFLSLFSFSPDCCVPDTAEYRQNHQQSWRPEQALFKGLSPASVLRRIESSFSCSACLAARKRAGFIYG